MATTLVRLELPCVVVNSRCFDPKKKELAYSIYSYIYIYIYIYSFFLATASWEQRDRMWNHSWLAVEGEAAAGFSSSCSWDEHSAAALGSAGFLDFGASLFHGVDCFVPCDDPSWESAGCPNFCEVHAQQQFRAAPRMQWWKRKFEERRESAATAHRLRCVGNLRPTNLGPLQPKGGRNKDGATRQIPMPGRRCCV